MHALKFREFYSGFLVLKAFNTATDTFNDTIEHLDNIDYVPVWHVDENRGLSLEVESMEASSNWNDDNEVVNDSGFESATWTSRNTATGRRKWTRILELLQGWYRSCVSLDYSWRWLISLWNDDVVSKTIALAGGKETVPNSGKMAAVSRNANGGATCR